MTSWRHSTLGMPLALLPSTMPMASLCQTDTRQSKAVVESSNTSDKTWVTELPVLKLVTLHSTQLTIKFRSSLKKWMEVETGHLSEVAIIWMDLVGLSLARTCKSGRRSTEHGRYTMIASTSYLYPDSNSHVSGHQSRHAIDFDNGSYNKLVVRTT